MEQCSKDGGHLPSLSELGIIASKLYVDKDNNPVTINSSTRITSEDYELNGYTTIEGFHFNSNSDIAKAIGYDANLSNFILWSSNLTSSNNTCAFPRNFYPMRTDTLSTTRKSTSVGVICLE